MTAAASATILVIVFSASACPPCLALKGSLAESPCDIDGIVVTIVDIRERPELAKKYRVTRTPTMVAIRDGGVVGNRAGYTGRSGFDEWLRGLRR